MKPPDILSRIIEREPRTEAERVEAFRTLAGFNKNQLFALEDRLITGGVLPKEAKLIDDQRADIRAATIAGRIGPLAEKHFN